MTRGLRLDANLAQGWPDFLNSGDPACGPDSAEEFYPIRGRLPKTGKKLCSRCPLTTECLAFALRTRQGFGVWGGTTPAERTQLLARGVCS